MVPTPAVVKSKSVLLNPFTSIPNMAKLAHADVEFNGGFKVQFWALVLIPVLTFDL